MGDKIYRDGVLQPDPNYMPPRCEIQFKLEQQAIKGILARLVALEEQAAMAGPPKSGPAKEAAVAAPQRINPITAQKMRQHAPELCDDECQEWADKLEHDRRYNSLCIGDKYDMDRMDAQRILFWMKHKGFLKYSETKPKGYYLP